MSNPSAYGRMSWLDRFGNCRPWSAIGVVVLMAACGGSGGSGGAEGLSSPSDDNDATGDGSLAAPQSDAAEPSALSGADCAEVFDGGRTGIVGYPVTFANSAAPCDYFLEGSLWFMGPVTIEPGTVLVMGRGARVRITDGVLDAIGTPDERIVFRGELSQQGYWRGIDLSDLRSSRLEHLDIRDGGTSGAGDGTPGLNVFESTVGLVDVSVSNSFVHGVELGGRVRLTAFADNRFFGNALEGLRIDAGLVHELSADNDYAGADVPNGRQVISIDGFSAIPPGVSWQPMNVPYSALGSLTLDSGERLTLSPGVSFAMDAQSSLRVMSNAALIAEGTAELPIEFASATDALDAWGGLVVSGEVVLRHVVVDGAGANGSTVEGAAIQLTLNGSLDISNTLIRRSAGDGLLCTSFGSSDRRGDIMLGNDVTFTEIAGTDIDPRCL